MGDAKKVLAEIDKILELRPESADFMRQRAVLLLQLGRPDDARAQFEKLHEAEPSDALTQMQLGMLYTSAKKYNKAVEMLTAVLTSHPNEGLAWRTRGDAYLNMGQRDKAVSDYDRALRLQPGDATILNNLAWVLATAPEKDLRDGERAVTLATDACKKTEYKEDYILSTLAAAYAEQGDFENAKKWAAKAVELSSKEHSGEIKKELQSYTDKKPWREALSGDHSAGDKANEGKSAGDKPK
jgi:Flp pilus assembly protein TadD